MYFLRSVLLLFLGSAAVYCHVLSPRHLPGAIQESARRNDASQNGASQNDASQNDASRSDSEPQHLYDRDLDTRRFGALNERELFHQFNPDVPLPNVPFSPHRTVPPALLDLPGLDEYHKSLKGHATLRPFPSLLQRSPPSQTSSNPNEVIVSSGEQKLLLFSETSQSMIITRLIDGDYGLAIISPRGAILCQIPNRKGFTGAADSDAHDQVTQVLNKWGIPYGGILGPGAVAILISKKVTLRYPHDTLSTIQGLFNHHRLTLRMDSSPINKYPVKIVIAKAPGMGDSPLLTIVDKNSTPSPVSPTSAPEKTTKDQPQPTVQKRAQTSRNVVRIQVGSGRQKIVYFFGPDQIRASLSNGNSAVVIISPNAAILGHIQPSRQVLATDTEADLLLLVKKQVSELIDLYHQNSHAFITNEYSVVVISVDRPYEPPLPPNHSSPTSSPLPPNIRLPTGNVAERVQYSSLTTLHDVIVKRLMKARLGQPRGEHLEKDINSEKKHVVLVTGNQTRGELPVLQADEKAVDYLKSLAYTKQPPKVKADHHLTPSHLLSPPIRRSLMFEGDDDPVRPPMLPKSSSDRDGKMEEQPHPTVQKRGHTSSKIGSVNVGMGNSELIDFEKPEYQDPVIKTLLDRTDTVVAIFSTQGAILGNIQLNKPHLINPQVNAIINIYQKNKNLFKKINADTDEYSVFVMSANLAPGITDLPKSHPGQSAHDHIVYRLEQAGIKPIREKHYPILSNPRVKYITITGNQDPWNIYPILKVDDQSLSSRPPQAPTRRSPTDQEDDGPVPPVPPRSPLRPSPYRLDDSSNAPPVPPRSPLRPSPYNVDDESTLLPPLLSPYDKGKSKSPVPLSLRPSPSPSKKKEKKPNELDFFQRRPLLSPIDEEEDNRIDSFESHIANTDQDRRRPQPPPNDSSSLPRKNAPQPPSDPRSRRLYTYETDDDDSVTHDSPPLIRRSEPPVSASEMDNDPPPIHSHLSPRYPTTSSPTTFLPPRPIPTPSSPATIAKLDDEAYDADDEDSMYPASNKPKGWQEWQGPGCQI